MLYHVILDQESLGYLKLGPDSFSLEEFKDKKQKRILENVIKAYFETGLKHKPADSGTEETLKPDDPRFVIELSQRLRSLGYVLA